MKVVIPQITWHSRDPVLSVDFDPSCKDGTEGFYRVATGGGDCALLVWRLSMVHESFKPEMKCVAELKRHEKPINIVRFSPSGEYIVTGGDDSYIILWKGEDKVGTPEEGEKWSFEKNFRKHVEDVSDLSWSPCGSFLISASIDNSAVLWDVKKGHCLHQWSEKEHTGFVHGVAYDPKKEFAVTMCIDRHLRFFDLKTKKLHCKALKYGEPWVEPSGAVVLDASEEKENSQENNASLQQVNPPNPPAGLQESNVNNTPVEQQDQPQPQPPPPKKPKAAPGDRLFQDEFLPTFCRRLSFSPNGELLLVPGGLLPKTKTSGGGNGATGAASLKENNAVVVFCRHSWITPCALIPTMESYSIAAKWCPIYFKRNRELYSYPNETLIPTKNERSFSSSAKLAPPRGESREQALMRMPYRLVYAVATNDSILIGDTASCEPLALVRSIHLARITDISWSSDGRVLMASSTDGYCSIMSFEDDELGSPFTHMYQPSLEELAIKSNKQEDSAPEHKSSPPSMPELARDCFPILPPEKKSTPVKKKAKKPQKTPQSSTKKTEQPKETDGKKKEGASQMDIDEAVRKMQMMKKKESPARVTVETSVVSIQNDQPMEASLQQNEEQQKVNTEKQSTETANSSGPGGVPSTNALKSGTLTPKVTPQRTTLDRWFKKGGASNPATPVSAASKNSSTPKAIISDPEVIVLDEDSEPSSDPSAPTSSVPALSEIKYPMTPPVSKKPLFSRINSSTPTAAAPLTQPTGNRQASSGLSPLEVHKLTTAPIKCREQLAEDPEIILQSSQERKSDDSSIANTTTTTPASSTQPPSPVSSTSSNGVAKAPRRIQLITIKDAATNKEGSLD